MPLAELGCQSCPRIFWKLPYKPDNDVYSVERNDLSFEEEAIQTSMRGAAISSQLTIPLPEALRLVKDVTGMTL